MGKFMKKACIVSGGTIEDDFAFAYIKKHQFDLCIAADAGISFFWRKGMRPDILVGDFDSAERGTLEFYRQAPHVEIVEFCPQKDDTDTEIAVRMAAERGATEVHLLGATGTRLDHVMANVGMLGLLQEQGIQGYLVDANNRIQMANHKVVLRKREQFGTYVSLLPVMGEVAGLTLSGFRYPLVDYTLGGFHSLGISNEIFEEEAVITMDSGWLLVVESKDGNEKM